jgi:hypothetical protein
VARVQVGELDVPLGALARRAPRGLAFTRDRPFPQGRRQDPLGLEQVYAAQEAGQEPSGVAADLVPAQGQVIDPVEQDREPVGGAHRGEERIATRLDRVLAQQHLPDLLVGVYPELGVRAVQQGLDASAQP